MPIVSILKKHLWEALGLPESFSQKDFEDLCFEFGVELDDVTSEREMHRRNTGEDLATASEEEIYKIDIPANRYDLLSLEGLCRALNIFRNKMELPRYRLLKPAKYEELIIHPSVKGIRPYVVACVLRGLSFNSVNFNSFIDLQEKLHQNICRQRTLVSIGTHDLDTIKGPFVYMAKPPSEIKFVPLYQTQELDGHALMANLENHLQLRKYLHIIKDSPLYPVIYDSNNVVLSLPPIINGAHSEITLKTKNVFIEVTATDKTKALIVLDTIAALFSQYCQEQYTCEPVIIRDGDNTELYPQWDSPRTCSVSVSEINSYLAQNFKSDEIINYLKRMGHTAKVDLSNNDIIQVILPPTRTDVLHACDLIEDVAIAFGYNNLGRSLPNTVTVGKQQPLNKLTDLLRIELSQHGYTECLTQSLCSRDENYKFLRKPDNNSAVVLANPANITFQVCRTSLLPGLLKSLSHNKAAQQPIKLFEISDIIIKDSTTDVGAKNKRMLAALFASKNTAGFEKIHGLLDRIMLALNVPAKYLEPTNEKAYYIAPSNEPLYFPGRAADIIYNNKKIGSLGILHPEVLQAYDIQFPVTTLEIEIELFV